LGKRLPLIVAGVCVAAAVIVAVWRVGGGGPAGESGPRIYRLSPAPYSEIGEIIIGADGLRGLYKPQNAGAPVDRIVSEAIYEPLVTMGSDGLPVNALAAAVAVSEDGLTYTVKLREGVLFHRGQTLDAGDVAASYAAVAGKNGPFEVFIAGILGYREYLAGGASGDDGLAGIRIIDPATVAFDFLTARPENIWALGVGVQNKEDSRDNDPEGLNGTGPYRYGGYDSALRQVTLLAHAAYREGPPGREKILVRDVPAADGPAAYSRGEINVFAFAYDEDVLDRLDNAPNLALYDYTGLEYSYLGLRCDSEKMEPRLRAALAYTFDKGRLAAAAYREGAAPLNLPLPPASFIAQKARSLPDYGKYGHDEREALRLFAQAGYQRDREGRLTRDGERLTLRLVAPEGELLAAELRELEAQLIDIGIEPLVSQYPDSVFREKVFQERDFDAYLYQRQAGRYIKSDNIFTAKALYRAEGWENDGAFARMEDIPLAASFEAAAAVYDDIIAAYLKDLPQIPLVAKNRFVAAHPSIEGFSFSPFQSLFWNIGALRIGGADSGTGPE
jgi:peptide/nickel transport system substrate-binding protein